jgi:hypothetical protein
LALAFGVSQPLVYYGLEDGTCPGWVLNYWALYDIGNNVFYGF